MCVNSNYIKQAVYNNYISSAHKNYENCMNFNYVSGASFYRCSVCQKGYVPDTNGYCYAVTKY